MKPTSITADSFANGAAFHAVTRNTQVGHQKAKRASPTNSAVIKRIKEMYEKPTALLMDWFRISERTAKRKLGGHRELSMEEIGRLIRSEQGFEIVTAIMGDAKPKWWKICVPLMDAASIREMQMVANKRLTKVLENAIEEDRLLSAAISRAENLSIQDEDHMRGHINALRSMRRVPNRAVAPKGRGK